MDGTFSNNQKNVLVVDDSKDNLYLMQFVLEMQGYKVLLANSGKQALKSAKEYQPDLILLDLMMPQMNGDEVVKRLRYDKSISGIPVLIVTANKYFTKVEAKRVGADGIVHKPIDLDYLLPRVASFFEAETTAK